MLLHYIFKMYLEKIFIFSRKCTKSFYNYQIFSNKLIVCFRNKNYKYFNQVAKVTTWNYLPYSLFHTSQRRLLPPWLLALYKLKGLKLLKGFSVLVGRSGRKIYNKLPLSIQNQISRHQILLYSSFGVTSVILYYSYVHYDTCPLTGRKRWISFTQSQILALAELDNDKLVKIYEPFFVNKDQPLYQICNEIVDMLVKRNSDIEIVKNINWNLNLVVDENICNAFVLPNGQIYLFTGMIKLMNDWPELAIVLSHEMAHSILGHVKEQQSFIVFGELLIIPILTFLWFWFEDFTAFFATLIEKYIFTLIFEVGFNLPYSRLLEAEADTVGLTLSTKACYDPRWAVLLWEKMSFKEVIDGLFQNQDDPSVIKFLSSHPTHDDRAIALEKKIPEMLQIREKCGCEKLSSLNPIKKALLFRRLSTNLRERIAINKEINAINSLPHLEKNQNSDIKIHLGKLEKAMKRLTAEWDATVEKESQTVLNAYEIFGFGAKSLNPVKESISCSDRLLQIVSNDLLSPDPAHYKKRKDRDYYTSIYA